MPSQLVAEDQKSGVRFVRWAVDALIASIWVAVCAMTPEFIWRGARVVVRHFSWGDVVSALFIGLILAFCVEPAMERLRHVFARQSHHPAGHMPSYSPLYAAAMGLAFALASVCLHDAISAFLAATSPDHAPRSTGLVTGIRIACAWAMVPFFTSLAWLGADRPVLRVPLAVLAALSPLAAGWLFSWSTQDIVSTELPCLVLLFLGYREQANGPRAGIFFRCARIIAWVAPIWLVAAMLLSMGLNQINLHRFALYTVPEAWLDARFYLGWGIGLLLAPFPRSHLQGRS